MRARLCVLGLSMCLGLFSACVADEGTLEVSGQGQAPGTPGIGDVQDPGDPGVGGRPGPGGLAGGETGGFDDHCQEEPAETDRVFERALCLCGDLGDVGQGLRTRSFSRTFGRHEGHGHVGINGTMDIIGYANVEGSLDVGADLKGAGKVTAEGDLQTGGHFGGLGSYGVLGQARINGDVTGIGYIKILGDLHLNGDVKTLGVVDYDALAGPFSYEASYRPCGCGAGQIIDVKAEVQSRRTQNNNSSLPTGGIGLREVTLRAGDYFFDSAEALIGAASITVEGRVGIFLDDDLDTLGHVEVNLTPGAELELWVSGSVRTVGNLRFAREEDARARAFKLYIGGDEAAVISVGNARFFGAIYAPSADIGFIGNLQVFGAVFANNLNGIGNLDIFYDTDITVPDDCADEYPDPIDDTQDCKDDSNCPEDEVCDELTHECEDEEDCENDSDCVGNDRCIDGECIVL